jgi:hypothetical protein
MRRWVTVAFCAAALAASNAWADGAVFMTAGGNLDFSKSSPLRGPVSVELVPSFGEVLRFDLGLYMRLVTNPSGQSDDDLSLRPGLRLGSPSFPFYLRAAMPLVLARQGLDYRLMLGAGLHLPVGEHASLLIEVDTWPAKEIVIRHDQLEGRAGLAFGF